jgi:hypothetical protein
LWIFHKQKQCIESIKDVTPLASENNPSSLPTESPVPETANWGNLVESVDEPMPDDQPNAVSQVYHFAQPVKN